MKRSEMISLIVNSIELHNGNDPGWLDYPEMKRQKEQAYDVASKLLSDLEEAGILPPLHIFKDQHEDYCATYDNDECTCNPFMNNQWEPEDE